MSVLVILIRVINSRISSKNSWTSSKIYGSKKLPRKEPLDSSLRMLGQHPGHNSSAKGWDKETPNPDVFSDPPSENVWEFQSSQLEKLSWMTGTLHGNLTHFFVLEFMGQAGQPGHEDFLAHIVSFPPILLVLVILVYIG